jgi:hypothetical protein
MHFMTILFASSLVIPGYESLSEEARTTFENSNPGKKFSQVAQSILTSFEELKTSSRFWHTFTGAAEQNKRAFQYQLSVQKKELLETIKETDEYKVLVTHLAHALLEQEIEDFQLLTQQQKQVLSRAEFSQKLYATLSELDDQIEKEMQARDDLGFWSKIDGTYASYDESITKLQGKRVEAIQLWKTEFLQSADMAPLRKTIEEQQKITKQKQLEQKRIFLQEHATQLSQFFPLLNYRKFVDEEPVIDQIRSKYSVGGEPITEPEKVDEQLLAELLYFCMQQMNHVEMDFINLDAFNKKHAHRMAQEILKAFNNKTKLELDEWFQKYENKLHKQVIKQLQLINGKKWEVRQNGLADDLLESLSYLWNNPAVNRANEFLRKMADAHGFIQATSFSTQNESSYLAILDVYNYARYHEQIAEGRTILNSLLSPLLPLYNEYKDIALYEKNPYWKSFRTIMPIVIVAAFIILVAVILSPLALPELAFTAAFIPALLIGLALATKYVSVKNEVYKNLRERYYGGAFEIPEFQVNPRMLGAFGTMEKASRVRAFYINGIKACDDLEREYSLKHEQGLLSQEDIDLRKENRKKRHQLCLEWYDIHSNNDLDFHRSSLIVSNRLQENSEQEFQQLKNVLQEEQESIRHCVAAATADLKETIVTHNKKPAIEKGQEKEVTTIKTHYRHGLFSPPRCLEFKAHIEELVDFNAQISVAVSC